MQLTSPCAGTLKNNLRLLFKTWNLIQWIILIDHTQRPRKGPTMFWVSSENIIKSFKNSYTKNYFEIEL